MYFRIKEASMQNVKRQKKLYQANSNYRKARVAILILGKIDFKKNIKMIRSIHQ